MLPLHIELCTVTNHERTTNMNIRTSYFGTFYCLYIGMFHILLNKVWIKNSIIMSTLRK